MPAIVPGRYVTSGAATATSPPAQQPDPGPGPITGYPAWEDPGRLVSQPGLGSDAESVSLSGVSAPVPGFAAGHRAAPSPVSSGVSVTRSGALSVPSRGVSGVSRPAGAARSAAPSLRGSAASKAAPGASPATAANAQGGTSGVARSTPAHAATPGLRASGRSPVAVSGAVARPTAQISAVAAPLGAHARGSFAGPGLGVEPAKLASAPKPDHSARLRFRSAARSASPASLTASPGSAAPAQAPIAASFSGASTASASFAGASGLSVPVGVVLRHRAAPGEAAPVPTTTEASGESAPNPGHAARFRFRSIALATPRPAAAASLAVPTLSPAATSTAAGARATGQAAEPGMAAAGIGAPVPAESGCSARPSLEYGASFASLAGGAAKAAANSGTPGLELSAGEERNAPPIYGLAAVAVMGSVLTASSVRTGASDHRATLRVRPTARSAKPPGSSAASHVGAPATTLFVSGAAGILALGGAGQGSGHGAAPGPPPIPVSGISEPAPARGSRAGPDAAFTDGPGARQAPSVAAGPQTGHRAAPRIRVRASGATDGASAFRAGEAAHSGEPEFLDLAGVLAVFGPGLPALALYETMSRNGVYTPAAGYDWLDRPYVDRRLDFVAEEDLAILFGVEEAAAEGVRVREERSVVIVEEARP